MKFNTGYNREGEYEHYTVQEPMPLLEWLLQNVTQTKTKIKATLQGRGVKVNGKTVSQFDFPLESSMKTAGLLSLRRLKVSSQWLQGIRP